MSNKSETATKVHYGKHSYQFVTVDGHSEQLGTPTVELRGSIEELKLMKPDTAEFLAGALLVAVYNARGQRPPPSIQAFLKPKGPRS